MSCNISPLPSALFTLMFCHPLKFNRSKVKFFIFFSKLFYSPDFPISLCAQSSRKHILGILAFVLHCLLSDMNLSAFLSFCATVPTAPVTSYSATYCLGDDGALLVHWFICFLSPFNLFCDHCHINLP